MANRNHRINQNRVYAELMLKKSEIGGCDKSEFNPGVNDIAATWPRYFGPHHSRFRRDGPGVNAQDRVGESDSALQGNIGRRYHVRSIKAGLLNRAAPPTGRPLNCAMKFGRCRSCALSSPVLGCVVRRPFTQLPSTFVRSASLRLIFVATSVFSTVGPILLI